MKNYLPAVACLGRPEESNLSDIDLLITYVHSKMMFKMSKRVLCVDWSLINGSAEKRRVLHLQKDNDGLFECPIEDCLHLGFKSSRGLRKHIGSIHPWYYYFNKRPEIKKQDVPRQQCEKYKSSTSNQAAYSIEEGAGKDFVDWLQLSCGGGKKEKEAVQGGRRGMKFLMACMGDTCDGANADESYIDTCLGTPDLFMTFIKTISTEWELRASGTLSYLKAIHDLMDFRKAEGVPDDVLRAFTSTEVYLRRGERNLGKKKNCSYFT